MITQAKAYGYLWVPVWCLFYEITQ